MDALIARIHALIDALAAAYAKTGVVNAMLTRPSVSGCCGYTLRVRPHGQGCPGCGSPRWCPNCYACALCRYEPHARRGL